MSHSVSLFLLCFVALQCLLFIVSYTLGLFDIIHVIDTHKKFSISIKIDFEITKMFITIIGITN